MLELGGICSDLLCNKGDLAQTEGSGLAGKLFGKWWGTSWRTRRRRGCWVVLFRGRMTLHRDLYVGEVNLFTKNMVVKIANSSIL